MFSVRLIFMNIIYCNNNIICISYFQFFKDNMQTFLIKNKKKKTIAIIILFYVNTFKFSLILFQIVL